MDIKATNEEYEIMFKTGEVVITEKLEEEFSIRKIGDKWSVYSIYEKDGIHESIEKLGIMANVDEETDILLTKTYSLELQDEEEANECVNSLFTPNFKANGYAMSRISFYVEMHGDIYSVEIDYDMGRRLTINISRFVFMEEEIEQRIIEFEEIINNIIKGVYSDARG